MYYAGIFLVFKCIANGWPVKTYSYMYVVLVALHIGVDLSEKENPSQLTDKQLIFFNISLFSFQPISMFLFVTVKIFIHDSICIISDPFHLLLQVIVSVNNCCIARGKKKKNGWSVKSYSYMKLGSHTNGPSPFFFCNTVPYFFISFL